MSNVITFTPRTTNKPVLPGRLGEIESMKALPFVSSEWKNKYWPEAMWADVPTNDYKADVERGKQLAVLTLGAMMTDNHPRALEMIFADIVEDAIRRRAKGGNGSRTLPAAVHGYLKVLAGFIAVCGDNARNRTGPSTSI